MAAATAAAGYYYISMLPVRLGAQINFEWHLEVPACLDSMLFTAFVACSNAWEVRCANPMGSWYAEDLHG